MSTNPKASRLLAPCMVFLIALGLPLGIQAGSEEGPPPTVEQIRARAAFSKHVERELGRRGARIAIVGRVGRPRSELPTGVQYTHVGIAVYSMITTADGRQLPGYAFHNLYQRHEQRDRSKLVVDAPIDFFVNASIAEAGILIPVPELQRRLLDIVTSPKYRALHEPRYSVLANPYDTQRQNCTEFVLDLITAALYETQDIAQIKANERAHFVAVAPRIGSLKLGLAGMFNRGITTSDHRGQVKIATFSSIAAYLERHQALADRIVIRDVDLVTKN